MAGVSLGGLSSGLDTQSIIDQLMAIDRAPETRMKLQQSALQARQQTLTDIGTRLRNLSDTVKDLGSTVTWANTPDARGLRQHEAERDAPQRRGARRPRDRGHLARALRAAQLRLHGERLDAQIGSAHIALSALGRRQRRRRQDQLERRLARLRGLRPGPARRHDEGPACPHPQGHRRVQRDRQAVSGADWTSTEAYTAGVNAKFTVDGGAPAGEPEQRRQERRPRPPAHASRAPGPRRSPWLPGARPGRDQGQGPGVRRPVQLDDRLHPHGAHREARPERDDRHGRPQGPAVRRPAAHGPALAAAQRDHRQDRRSAARSSRSPTSASRPAPAPAAPRAPTRSPASSRSTRQARPTRSTDNRLDVKSFLTDTTKGISAKLDGLLDPVAKASTGLIDVRANEAGERVVGHRRPDPARSRTGSAQRQDRLHAQFTAMEQALAQSQSQGSWLTAQLGYALNSQPFLPITVASSAPIPSEAHVRVRPRPQRLPRERRPDGHAGAARRDALRRREPLPDPVGHRDARRPCRPGGREAPPRRGDHRRAPLDARHVGRRDRRASPGALPVPQGAPLSARLKQDAGKVDEVAGFMRELRGVGRDRRRETQPRVPHNSVTSPIEQPRRVTAYERLAELAEAERDHAVAGRIDELLAVQARGRSPRRHPSGEGARRAPARTSSAPRPRAPRSPLPWRPPCAPPAPTPCTSSRAASPWPRTGRLRRPFRASRTAAEGRLARRTRRVRSSLRRRTARRGEGGPAPGGVMRVVSAQVHNEHRPRSLSHVAAVRGATSRCIDESGTPQTLKEFPQPADDLASTHGRVRGTVQGRTPLPGSPYPKWNCSTSLSSASSAPSPAPPLRQTALANNIANANTPGYQRQDVDFHSALQAALASGEPRAVASAPLRRQTDADDAMRADGSTSTSTSSRPSSPRTASSTRRSSRSPRGRIDILESAMGR